MFAIMWGGGASDALATGALLHPPPYLLPALFVNGVVLQSLVTLLQSNFGNLASCAHGIVSSDTTREVNGDDNKQRTQGFSE